MIEMIMFDVAEEVLLRLPVKDLLRCNSVCKSWYSLISSHSFVKTHRKFICNKEDKNNTQLGNKRIAMSRGYIIRKRDRYMIPDEWNSYHSLRIQGSSNGLVCISQYENRICLTNPSTREFRKLHKPPTILPKDDSYAWRCYGFGYDSSTDDYKLVMAINQGSDGTLVHILSLKLNVWKVFGQVNYRFDDASLVKPGILFNGALHWFMYDINMDKILIVSFNLAKEEFGEISQPDDTRYDRSSYCNALGIFEDCLCISGESNDGRLRGIWVMKNYNDKQSWELLPTDCEMKNRVHYMINDCLLSRKMPSYYCCENIFLSRSVEYIGSPIFVQTLVSPYINYHGRPCDVKDSKRTVKSTSGKERREIEELRTRKDGENNEFHLEEDGETERKKRKRKRRAGVFKRWFKDST